MAVAVPEAPTEERQSVDPRGPGLDWGLKRIQRALKRHDPRCSRYAARERVWLATREGESERPNHQQIRFAYQRTDVLMAYLTADKPVGRVAPLRPTAECAEAAKCLQKATNEWRRRDHRDEKEIELALNACVYGVAPGKSIWDYERVLQRSRRVKRTFMGVGPPKVSEVEDYVILRDEPSLIPWNPYDLAWDPSATDAEDMRYVVAFSYPTKDELLAGQEKGWYSNVDDLAPNNERQAKEFQRPGRERDLEGRIEVAEIWDKEQNRLVAIGNRQTLIRDCDSPYWHHEIPFSFATTQKSLWTLDGTSEVEVIAAIQAEMHQFRGEWIRNAKLANKLLLIVDASIDPKVMDTVNNSLMVDDGKPVQVLPFDAYAQPPTTWSPAASLVPLGEQIISALKTDMDDMSGVNQYISGQTDSQVDPKTATEVQQLATASARRVNAKKNMLARSGFQRASVQDLKNAKQFLSMDKPLQIRLEGRVPDATIPGGEYSFDAVDPQTVVDAEFEFLMTDADESIDKQEQRGQWLTLFNTFTAAAAVFPPGSLMPNFGKLAEKVLEVFDVEDVDEFMVEPLPPMPIAPMPGPGVTPPGVGLAQGASPPAPATPPLGGPGLAAPNPLVPGGFA